MTWVKVDDHFSEHPKMAKVGPLEWGFWLAGLAYCNRNLTDGFIPWAVARSLCSFEYAPVEGDENLLRAGIIVGEADRDGMFAGFPVDPTWVVNALLNAGLWEMAPGGYRVHDFGEYQPSKEEIETQRAKTAGRVRKHRAGNAPRNAVGNGHVTDTPYPVARTRSTSPIGDVLPPANGTLSPDDGPLLWLSRHKAGIPEGNGLHLHLIDLCERHGPEKVIATFEAMPAGTGRTYILGAENILDVIARPDGKAQAEAEREAERQAAAQRRLDATQARLRELRGAADA